MNYRSDDSKQDLIEELVSLLGRARIEEQVLLHNEFRAARSPTELWSHRTPGMSPLIPLIVESRKHSRPTHITPLDYWYGSPQDLLERVARWIKLFSEFWENLPDGTGRKYLSDELLRSAGGFQQLSYKLKVAAQFTMCSKFNVLPLFLDTDSHEGQPDILLTEGEQEIAVWCASLHPIDALLLPFDDFQYLVGCLIRAAEDVQRSCEITLTIKDKLHPRDISSIISQAAEQISSKRYWSRPVNTQRYALTMRELSLGSSGATDSTIHSLVGKAPFGGCVVPVGWNRGSDSSDYSQFAVVRVVPQNPIGLIPWLLEQIRIVAEASQKHMPTRLLFHVYGSIGSILGTETEWTQRELYGRICDFCKLYPAIQRVQLSSDAQEYRQLISPGGTISNVAAVDVQNPYFAV